MDQQSNSANCSKNSIEQYSDYSIAYIELTDMGLFHERQQLESALEIVRNSEKQGPTNVVVFVHGWKHSAAHTDKNVENFAKDAMQVISKNRLSDGSKVRTIGIYVGWRGTPLLALHDLSFYDRKSSADHISKGSLRELIGHLRAMRSGESPKINVTLVGHSFGGLILFSAISGSIMDSLTQSTYAVLDKAPASPIYDAAILINPAFEGIRFEPIFQAAKAHRSDSAGLAQWSPEQRPLLVAITSEADGATKTAFPIVRFINSLFQRETLTDQDSRVNSEYPKRIEKQGNTNTIGHLDRYKTHKLKMEETGVSCTEFKTNKLIDHPNRFPLWNMSASSDLIPDHTNIYNDKLWKFIATLSTRNATGESICTGASAALASQ